MKAFVLTVASIGLAMGMTPAYAAHLSPANTSKTLSGDASLGSLQCYLDLDVTTGNPDSPSSGAKDGTIDGGVNDPVKSPDPACVGVKVDSGTFELDQGSYDATGGDAGLGDATGWVYNLQVSVYNTGTASWDACPTANIPIYVQKLDNTPTVEVLLSGTIPFCGAATAALTGNYDLIP